MRKGFPISLSLCVLLVACVADAPTASRSDDLTPFTAPSLAALSMRELEAASQGRLARGIEDEYLRIELSSPGFGGMYFDTTSGEIVVHQRGGRAAEERVRGQLSASSSFAQSITLLRERPVRVKPGAFAFSELVAFQKILIAEQALNKLVYSVDADEMTNTVTVGVFSDADVGRVRALATKRGIPSSALRITVNSNLPVITAGLRGTWRPTGGGVQISMYGSSGQEIDPGVCTLGYNVRDAFGNKMVLFASHCVNYWLTLYNGPLGQAYGQPYRAASFDFGSVSTNPSWTTTPNCPTTWCTWADAAVLAYFPGLSGLHWSARVARTQFVGTNSAGGSITVSGWSTVAAVASPLPGQVVDKMGRTTGWTRGTQGPTCVSNPVVIPGVLPISMLTVGCTGQIYDARGFGGDSGGPVFQTVAPGIVHAVGIVYGANVAPNLGICGPPQNPGCLAYTLYSPWHALETVVGYTLNPRTI